MFYRPRTPFAIVFVILVATVGSTQNAPTAGNHPKLGLVLEGGGALGLAHIGVIQWLEEHRIPVSYIAGTSMGGLVGGTYATGRNAAEVRDLVEEIDWNQVIGGQTPFEDLTFRRKQDARDYPTTLEFGLRNGFHPPSGFNSGQQVQLFLDRIALPYSQIKSFNDLPIPFACVATDLVSEEAHVFRDGPLELALRSTMSLPGFFSPVRSGDHIYVDGGLLDNFPVGIAKEMGADIVLGIHLETASLKPDAALSSVEVLSQSISVVIAVNEKRSMADADLVVTVPLQKYSSTDYDKSDAIIKIGYDAAAANADKLSRLSVDAASWQQYLAEREARRRSAAIPQFVEVTGVPPEIAAPLTKQLSALAGQPVDSATLDKKILQLTGMGPYSSFNYSMVEKDGQPGLAFQAQPKPYSPPIMRPLILINGASYNNVFFSMGARITFLDFGGYRRELRNDVIVGSQYGLQSEYYKPFSPADNWFVAPRAGFNSTQVPLYSGNDFIALYRNQLTLGGLDFGYALGRVGELRLGYEGGYQRLYPQIGSTKELPTVSGVTGDVKLQFQLDTLDEPVVPRSGEHILFYTKYFNENPAAPHGFPVSELQSLNFFPVNDPSSIFLNGYGGSTYGFNPGIPAFPIGGITRFVAFGTNELLTNQYVLGQLGYLRRLKYLTPPLGSTIDFLAMFELGKTYSIPFGPKPPYLPGDVAAAFIVNTLFGPVEVGGAVGNYGHAKFFFQVGRVF
jgi:NTE family protein